MEELPRLGPLPPITNANEAAALRAALGGYEYAAELLEPGNDRRAEAARAATEIRTRLMEWDARNEA